MKIGKIFKNKKVISIFCILLGVVYYICFFGKLFYYLGLHFLDIFDLIFEGFTLATAINPAIIICWSFYVSNYFDLPIWFFFVNYFIIAIPPLLFLIGGAGLLKQRRYAKTMLKIYGIYWILSFLVTVFL